MPIDVASLLAANPDDLPDGAVLGRSREGRPVHGWRFGRGGSRVSLIGGCHADEPVGPLLLRRLVAHLGALPASDPALANLDWWIVPDANPDGSARNARWIDVMGDTVDPVAFLRHVHREPPGDDVEFGFPRDARDRDARPENRALLDWWRTARGPFALHASLHGMVVAQGPWFLIEKSWANRSADLQETCRRRTAELGHALHDVDRRGDKGFWRIGPGFTTRPDSREMIRYFRDRGDEATAARFRPTSMEAIVSLGGDPLTLVSEMPLFVLPALPGGARPGSREVAAWTERLGAWQRRLAAGEDERAVRTEVDAAGLRPMPLREQMDLQWTFVRAGIRTAAAGA